MEAPGSPAAFASLTGALRIVRTWTRRLVPATRGFIRVMRANPLTLVGFLMVVVVVVVAVLVVAVPAISGAIGGQRASILPYDPNYYPSPCPSRTIQTSNGSYETCTLPPSLQHLFGTDNLGRDIFSRVLAALPLDLESEEHTSELQSRFDLVCRLLLEKKNRPHGRKHRRAICLFSARRLGRRSHSHPRPFLRRHGGFRDGPAARTA